MSEQAVATNDELRRRIAALADEFEADFLAFRHDYPASYLRLRALLTPPPGQTP